MKHEHIYVSDTQTVVCKATECSLQLTCGSTIILENKYG
jgi:hypothetical protein